MTFDEITTSIRAFQESRALLTAIELDVFTAVGDGATAGEVAESIGADPRAIEMLLNSLAALGALTKKKDRFRNTPHTTKHLDARSPACSRDALMHSVHLWDRWSTLTECVRGGRAKAERKAEGGGPDWIEAFIAAMHRNAGLRAPRVVRAVGVKGVRRMLDVGGGSGAYSIAFAQASPTLQATILDRAPVLAIARRHIRKAGLADRIATRTGDLTSNKFGRGYDLVFVSQICHMLGPDENLDLFRRSYAALAPGGRIAVQDFILEPDKTAPVGAALFALNMLVGTEHGSSYSEPEYAAWLRDAGFQDVRRIRLEEPAGLMLGTRGLD
jgi:SAM-dependent methyltransferase